MIATGYRSEIDGLRAIAVLSVLLFHVGAPFIGGGFAGVDIFFAISGYVIFSKVAKDVEAGTFSTLAFYRNRILRIVPSLLLVVLLSLAAGYVILTPAEFIRLAESALAAIFSVSNLYFADSSGYFSASAETMPLLHTWSLGVEEQFYLLAPLIAVTAGARFGLNGVKYTIAAILVVSFAFNIASIYVHADAETAFYSPLTRLWEIAAGGLAATIRPDWKAGRIGSSGVLSLIGAAGLALSLFALSSKMPFPGWAAVLPVLSAVLILTDDAPRNRAVQKALSFGPLVYVGKISYTLYLVHWPIIVYTKLVLGRDLAIWEMAGIVMLSLGLAAAIYRFYEAPLRFARTGKPWLRAWVYLATAAVGCVAASAVIVTSAGLESRLTPRARAILAARQDPTEHISQCQRFERAASIDRATICNLPAGGRGTSFLLWGDSHAGMYGEQLGARMAALGRPGLIANMADCQSLLDTYTSKRKNREACALLGQEVLRLVRDERIPVVILAARWATLGSPVRAPGDGDFSKTLYDARNEGRETSLQVALTRTVQQFTALGARVVIIGPTPEMDFDVPDLLVRSANLGSGIPASTRLSFDERQAVVLPALKALEAVPGVSVVYPHRSLCDATACRYATGDIPLYTDDDHLSRAGVDTVLPGILATIRP